MFHKTGKGYIRGTIIGMFVLMAVFLSPVELLMDREPARKDITVENKRLLMGYYDKGWNQETRGWPSLKKHFRDLDILCPNWYSIDYRGNLMLSRGSLEAEMSQLLGEQGIKPVPLITNHKGNYQVLADDQARRQAVENISRLVTEQGYDGVNIDFERLPPEQAGNLTRFVELVSQSLKPRNKIVMVSVFPKVDFPQRLHGAHDHQALAPFVDYLCLMAYDKSSPRTGPGPVAPLPWVEKNVQHSLETVPPGKLLLSIGAYGYDWSAGGGAEALGLEQALNRAGLNKAQILWDSQNQVPYYQYGRHKVWFENPRSAAKKAELVKKYNLAGLAFWRLGYENDEYFNVLKEELGHRE
ncbi:MAG: glycosyl hydrolase family 18 protein [Bacillota bacterium]